MGIALAGSSIGGVMYPVALKALFDRVGFEWGVRVSGLISGVCCGIAVLTVTTIEKDITGKVNSSKPLLDTPFVMLTAGSAFVALGIFFDFVLFLTQLISDSGLFIPFFYVTEYTQDTLRTSGQSYTVLAVLNAGGLIGRIAPAYFSDLLGCFNLIAPSSLLCGLLVLLLWPFSHSLGSVMAFAALYGFFSGAFISLITPCVAQISEPTKIGSRIGMLYALVSFPALLGGPIAGIIKEHSGGYLGLMMFAGAGLCVGGLLLFVTRFILKRQFLVKV
jgi:MFS family permease